MADDLQLTDDEKQALLAYRRESAPKRKGTVRRTDPDSGAEYEVELTPEEAARVVAGLFKDDDGKKDDDKDKAKKPAVLKDYFGKKQAAGS